MSYKLYKTGEHYIAKRVERRKVNNKEKSLVTIYNESIEGLEEAFVNAFNETLTWTDRRFNKDEKEVFKIKRYQFILQKLYTEIGEDYLFEEYCEQAIARRLNNIHHRRKLFIRKAELNDWNYFITFTYDSKKHTEESFRKSLRKCLSNLSFRRNWVIMGKFERSETGRLHFHAIAYIPDNQMVGYIYEDTYYNFEKFKLDTAHRNSFFNEKFGYSDFQQIDEIVLKFTKTIEYIIKYINKEPDEKIFYSRGIPSSIIATTGIDNEDLYCNFFDFCEKFLLWDTVIKRIPNTKQFIFIEKDIRQYHNTIRLVS